MKIKLLIFPLLIVLSGCATYGGPMQQGSIQAVQAFQTGQVRLNCGYRCAREWNSNFGDLVSLYSAGQWQALAESVIRIGYVSDLSYYYLASAAEAIGYADAAVTYYQLGVELSRDPDPARHCRDSLEGCAGIDVANLLPQRLAALEKARRPPMPLTDEERAELQNILYVHHAAEVCAWPVSPIVRDEMNAYLDYYRQRLEYEKYNEEDAKAVQEINRRGKKVCASAKERKRFDDAVSAIVPFTKAHAEVVASRTAQQQPEVPSTAQGAVEVKYVYTAGFWWGTLWFPGGYYDPYWRYYGVYPGPRYVYPPGYSWRPGYPGYYHGYPGYWGRRGYAYPPPAAPRYGGPYYRGGPGRRW
jgi:hypothetical protein